MAGELIIYQNDDGTIRLETRLEDETLWLTQQQMAELFQTTVPNINMHIKNVFQDGELQPEATIQDFLIVRQEGRRQVQRAVSHCNLDMVISVGYRVKSLLATRFRIWATAQLKEYIVKGFVMDDERLKNPVVVGRAAPDFFDEMLARIRDIRASERRVYNLLLASTLALSGLAMSASTHATPLKFNTCTDTEKHADLRATLCATVKVPLSHPDNSTDKSQTGEQIDLFIRKFPAIGPSKGRVWIINGGPGESGATTYTFIATLRRSFPHLDLLIPDHRGTGFSGKICPKEQAETSPGGIGLSGAEWATCFQAMHETAPRTRQFTITNAAHDLQYLIQAEHDNQPSYAYGVSYGTQLILRTLQLGKSPLKAIVLDSLVPQQGNSDYDLSRRSHVINQVGQQVLKQCDADPACHQMMGQDAIPVYHQLLADLEQHPERANEIPGKNLKRFLARLLDFPSARARIPYLIKDLAQGKNDELKAVNQKLDEILSVFGDYPQSPSSLPLTQIISGSENTLRPTISAQEVKENEKSLLFADGLAGFLTAPFSFPVYAQDRYFNQEPRTFPPILVMQGKLDPKTPYAGALLHVNALKANGPIQLVAAAKAPHFLLAFAPECFAKVSRAFILNQPLPYQACD